MIKFDLNKSIYSFSFNRDRSMIMAGGQKSLFIAKIEGKFDNHSSSVPDI